MSFYERPNENTRTRVVNYVNELIENKRLTDDKHSSVEIEYLLEIQKHLNKKKYGLVWEEHSEVVEEEMEFSIPVFEEVKEKKIEKDLMNLKYNFLLEGDNLHCLHLLEKTHENKVDAIYIDPPYNTGAKNWRYNNAFVDDKDTFRHSKWISFMAARLKIAKKLLKKTGIIVVTIDDYELENLILLMNEIFGENNHLGTVVIKNNPQGRSSVTGFQVSHEYALFYGREEAKIGRIQRNEAQKSRYKEIDEYGPFEWRNFRAQYSTESPTMIYPIYIKQDLSDFRIPNLKWDDENQQYEILEDLEEDEVVSWPKDADGRMRTWKWSINTVEVKKESEMGIRLDRQKKPSVYYKGRMVEKDMLPFTFWEDPKYSASTFGANLLSDYIGKGKFNYPKSLYAVEDALKVATRNKKDALILDFFAGSGTTGHAVLNLNNEDGGNRSFILATNNENNIAEEVTFERLKKISEGVSGKSKKEKILYQESISVSKLKSFVKNPQKLEIMLNKAQSIKEDFEKNSNKEKALAKVKFIDNEIRVSGHFETNHKWEPLPFNLKYFKTKFIPKEVSSLEKELLLNIKALVELAHGVDLNNSEYDLVLTREDMKSINLDNITTIYMRGRVRRMMTPDQQERYFSSGITIVDIPEFFFAEELRDWI
ncbi:site-specific DNA-methyltransferase [Oceanobacillus kimchii]|uniref:site-specific DNA-methyltransferase n=1 Tax=Oceanobacillus kimchii TaxID=746691 RepID=UPI0021A55672|nr:site-specific DNA-methyltransferase [Oceanobacillus kimchii]MCT1577297.1 site-specific DNA-methyltransferase [Oceanobacillus kimchii]MCT2136903.1 site-specific DNA-methyltransferase [Oceanobacillus kimchii]